MQVSSAGGTQAAEYMRQMREKMFSRADGDGSGGLSLDEFSAIGQGRNGTGAAESAGSAASAAATDRAKEAFSRLDTDGDGSLTQAEMEAGRPPPPNGGMAPDTMSALLSSQESATGSGSATGSTANSNGLAELFSSLDADGDGSLSATEFEAAQGTQETRRGPPPGGPPPGGPLPDGQDGSQDGSGTTSGTGSAASQLLAMMEKALQSYMQGGGAARTPSSSLEVAA